MAVWHPGWIVPSGLAGQLAAAPMPGPPGGQSAIALTTKYLKVPMWIFALYVPEVLINGYPCVARWGRTVIPVPPGRHSVHVRIPALVRGLGYYSPATFTVTVPPGQVVELEYRASIWWMGGSLGPPPQRYRGMRLFLVLQIGVPLVLATAALAAFLLAGDR